MLGTGIPKVTYTGKTFADELRINLVDPGRRRTRTGWACSAATTPASRTAAGSSDDVVDIEEQAVAGFLKGNKVPLGDGVNAERHAVPRALPVRADAALGLHELEGDQLSRDRDREARSCGAGRPTSRSSTRMTNKLLIAIAAVIAAGFAALFGGVLDEPQAAPPDALAASQSAEDFKAGFALNASTTSLVRSLQATLEANATDEHSWALLGLAYQQRARETGDPSYYTKSGGALDRALDARLARTTSCTAGSARSRSRATASRWRCSSARRRTRSRRRRRATTA